jgi:hypothetical protein|tara:strand:+ start:718 stop:1005 length:288 start_codon:yes stop_codon:yes gene_type:complete
MPDKEYYNLKGTVQLIGDAVHIPRNGIPDLHKRVLTITTADGQTLFPEIRNGNLNQLDTQKIMEGTNVEIKFLFQGSEKNGKRYNNIYIHEITRI